MNLHELPAAATAIPVGIAFGVVLERVGLGDPRVVSGQLSGRDFTVVRVMFGAIVTAMLLLLWASTAGWVDVGALAIPPTDAGAQALGAVIFGGGFGLAALCPGTACVAASSGRRDGLAAVGGMLLGTAATPIVWPAVGVVAGTPREGARLPEDLGWPVWAVALAITVASVAASMMARRLKREEHGPPWWRVTSVETAALTLALAFAAVDGGTLASPGRLQTIAQEVASEGDHVDPLDLADWIRAGRPGLRVIDVRDGVDRDTYRIPGSELVSLERVPALPIGDKETVVLYSDGGTHAAQAWVLLRARGVRKVKVLKDGMAAWEDEVLSPVAAAVPDDTSRARYQRARALATWFGGRPRLRPVGEVSGATGAGSATSAPRKRRRNTC